MVVIRDIPQPNDIIAQSQPQLLANNVGYVDTFAINHVPYNDVGGGKHKFCVYVNQSPVPVTTAAEGAVYTKDSAVLPGRSDLYYKYQTSGVTSMTGREFPLSFVRGLVQVNRTGPSFFQAGTDFNIASVTLVGHLWTITLNDNVSDSGDKIMVHTTVRPSGGLLITVPDPKTISLQGTTTTNNIAVMILAL